MADKVWTYWEGPKPKHIAECLATMEKVCGERLIVVTPETVDQYLPDAVLHHRWEEVPTIASKVCFLRAAILFSHGGWWFDADTVMLREPGNADTFTFTTWDEEPFRVLSGCFGTPKGHRIMKLWIAGLNDILESEFDDVKSWWLVPGEKLLSPIVKRWYFRGGCRRVNLSTWFPLNVDKKPWQFVNPGYVDELIKPETICIGLNNSWLMDKCAGLLAMSNEEQERSPILLHSILTKAREVARA